MITYAKDLDNILRGSSHANIRTISLTTESDICVAIWIPNVANRADPTAKIAPSIKKKQDIK